MGDSIQAMRRWRDLGDKSNTHFFAYTLEHKYTDIGLRLSQLKGDDYYRVPHVAQSCAEPREFYVLLANMKMYKVKPNDEDESREECELSLTRIVDLEGFSLSLYQELFIPETALLQEGLYDRLPETQRGGE